jgi:protease-4
MQRPLWKDLVLLGAKSITTVITVVLVLVIGSATIGALWEGESKISDGTCNIAVLPVEGIILPFTGFGEFDLITTPDVVNEFVAVAEHDETIKGLLIEINSPGGTPVASHNIAEQLFDSTLPVVGLVGDVGASGGYMVAAATDFLIASPMSDIGSIGVNMSYIENSKKNEEDGLTYVQLIAGEYKDIGSPERPITDEERELLQRDLDIVHSEFIDIVAQYRDMDRDTVAQLADGTTMPGRRALDSGLVDALGNRTQARAAFAGFLDMPLDEIEFCEYEAPLLPI